MKTFLNSKLRDPERALSRLVRLSQETFGDELSMREQAGLARFEQAVARRTLKGRGRLVWALGFGAAVALTASVLMLRQRDGALTFNVMNGTVSDGGYVRATMEGGTEIRFSDGSNLALEPGTRTRVAELNARGGRVLLESGRARVHVMPRPRAKWTVDAGPYSVHVIGTVFDVRWSGNEEVLDVRLHKGSIVVRGPLASQGLAMEAGQHLVANVREGEIFLDGKPFGDDEVVAPSHAAAEPSPPPRFDAPAPLLRKNPPKAGSRAGAVASSGGSGPGSDLGPAWSKRLAHGDFQGVLNEAEQRGLDATLNAGSRAELTALADAARYARRGEVARRALLAERQRFSGSLQGREAAFFLGGLTEDERGQGASAAALAWYDRYLSESPQGAYAPQALGRKMVILHRLRGAGAARAVAVEYLDRFPDGPYAAPARKLLEVP
jgi:hypothetical protein